MIAWRGTRVEIKCIHRPLLHAGVGEQRKRQSNENSRWMVSDAIYDLSLFEREKVRSIPYIDAIYHCLHLLWGKTVVSRDILYIRVCSVVRMIAAQEYVGWWKMIWIIDWFLYTLVILRVWAVVYVCVFDCVYVCVCVYFPLSHILKKKHF